MIVYKHVGLGIYIRAWSFFIVIIIMFLENHDVKLHRCIALRRNYMYKSNEIEPKCLI